MANKAKPGRFTEAELELMNILWESGPSTVQGVVDHLPTDYEAAVSRFDAASTALHDLVDKLFGGSPEQVVLAMVRSRQLSPQKLYELRRLIDDADGRNRK